MNARDVGIGLVLGALVGGIGTWVARLAGPEPVVFGSTPAAVVLPVVAEVCPPCPACDEVAPDAIAGVIEAQDAQIRGLSQTAFGTPLSWPAPAVQAEMVAKIRETLEGCGPEVQAVETDCSEPPCLVALSLGAKQAGDVMDLCPAWKENLGFRGYASRQKTCPDGSVQNFTVMYATSPAVYRAATDAPEAGENEEIRDRIRKEDLAAAFVCR